ncbi:MAG: (2Fe-2S)-binding protein [Kiritimatiellae bacterium]|jgi:carbon-monoxide dehydrogenase small subunit|nr:(2Fe-2S)-binding protein [Kiritimatiellia bacterium]NLD90811.1 (2Fe-2S)-binding protein [Lentisphaerota bacterium]HOU21032.1 (2Fe-2S)-binding protein [Kiritimatiellia bacterium]HPC20358.1 (2Fe-2S)-binding protein [Kiritimatiellia bacterium]HQN81005.1 (2Fe-2S)-binding protein [Kiritimatiellia bacterium]
MKDIAIRLNGQVRRLAVNPNETLLEVLRGKLGIKTPKEGCGRGDCGACTVLLNGKAVRSCLILAVEADGQSVTTLEGVGRAGPTALQKAFIRSNAFQCGFCTPGVVLAASALLAEKPAPTELDVREALAGNLCRCTGYEAMVKTVMAAARKSNRKRSSSRRSRP